MVVESSRADQQEAVAIGAAMVVISSDSSRRREGERGKWGGKEG